MLLVKPLTFMNLSGQAIRALADFHKVDVGDVLVVADDVNLPLGPLRAPVRRVGGRAQRVQVGRPAPRHQQFPRLRVGVGRGDNRRDLADHVLAKFDTDERPVIEEAIRQAADAGELFAREGIATVMNRFKWPVRRSRRKSPTMRRTVNPDCRGPWWAGGAELDSLPPAPATSRAAGGRSAGR